MDVLSLCCFLLGILTNVQGDKGCDVKIEISPEKTVPLLDEPVTITCELVINVKHTMMLSVSKEGKNPIAYMRQGSTKVAFGIQNKMRYKANGQIKMNSVRKYLELTILHPSTEDSGLYTCSAVYFNMKNSVRTDSVQSNLSVESDLDNKRIEMVLTHVLDKMSGLESDNKKLLQEIDKLNETVKEMNKTNNNKQSELMLELKDKVRELNETTSTQSSLIQDLTYKVTFSTAFSVTNFYDYIYSVHGDTLILPNILTLQGTGYNVTTGVFTAPTPGLYVFHVVVDAFRANDDFELELMANSKLLAKLSTDEDARHYTQSSISSVVDLKAGDQVYAVMKDLGFTLNVGTYTVFTGYLIKAW